MWWKCSDGLWQKISNGMERVRTLEIWRRGCSCWSGVVKHSISFGEHRNCTQEAVVNYPSHQVMILGDEKHIEGFLEDLGKE